MAPLITVEDAAALLRSGRATLHKTQKLNLLISFGVGAD
jgi:hypothetical protein